MKNWIIVLLIFILPLGLYAFLDAKAQKPMMCAGKLSTDIADSKLKIIKFSSPMCSECKEAALELSKVPKEYKDAFVLEEINVNETIGKNASHTKDAIKKYKITLVPTLVFINKEGKLVYKKEGAMTSSEIVQILDENK